MMRVYPIIPLHFSIIRWNPRLSSSLTISIGVSLETTIQYYHIHHSHYDWSSSSWKIKEKWDTILDWAWKIKIGAACSISTEPAMTGRIEIIWGKIWRTMHLVTWGPRSLRWKGNFVYWNLKFWTFTLFIEHVREVDLT